MYRKIRNVLDRTSCGIGLILHRCVRRESTHHGVIHSHTLTHTRIVMGGPPCNAVLQSTSTPASNIIFSSPEMVLNCHACLARCF
jgi:hypothetical protein